MVIIKSKREIDIMREAAKVTGEILRDIEGFIKPGMTTHAIDNFVEERILHYKMKPPCRLWRIACCGLRIC